MPRKQQEHTYTYDRSTPIIHLHEPSYQKTALGQREVSEGEGIATKPGKLSLSLFPGTHMVKENQLLNDLHEYVHRHTHST